MGYSELFALMLCNVENKPVYQHLSRKCEERDKKRGGEEAGQNIAGKALVHPLLSVQQFSVSCHLNNTTERMLGIDK